MALEAMFASQSRARLMQLRLQLQTTKKSTLSMVEYLQKIKTFVNNLAATAQPVSDDDLILYVCGGLGPKYDASVVFVTARVDPISLADLQGLLLSHEYRLEQATVVEQGLGQANLMVKNSNKNDTFFKRNQASNQSYGGKYSCGRGRGPRNNNPNHSQPSSNVS
ncbi:uncharacterized protein LOC124895592 [Capsicum annuum]|uniref:uncharacterized protein LOC124895592 n=1 Tax=Capsicum annuum TaxID=4072 RepID=UPI001FB110FD|nr:uncharacterized protein LOC124895592 [Capsicum annuum]